MERAGFPVVKVWSDEEVARILTGKRLLCVRASFRLSIAIARSATEEQL